MAILNGNTMIGGREILPEIDAFQTEVTTHKVEKATLTSDGHVQNGTYTANVSTPWTGTSAPFTKVVTVIGMQPTDTPIVDIALTGTFATDEAITDSWGYVYRIVTSDNSIMLYATEKPEVWIPIQLKVVR